MAGRYEPFGGVPEARCPEQQNESTSFVLIIGLKCRLCNQFADCADYGDMESNIQMCRYC